MTTAQYEYEGLIDRISDEEPVCGYSNVMQMDLTDADVATVVANQPDLVADAVVPVTEYMRRAQGEKP